MSKRVGVGESEHECWRERARVGERAREGGREGARQGERAQGVSMACETGG